MKRNLLSLFILFSTQFIIQAHSIKGKVVDPDGLPVIGAYIFHNSDGIHSHSNDLGYFVCENCLIGDTLKFTYLGFETLEYVLDQSDFEKVKEQTVKFWKGQELNDVHNKLKDSLY